MHSFECVCVSEFISNLLCFIFIVFLCSIFINLFFWCTYITSCLKYFWKWDRVWSNIEDAITNHFYFSDLQSNVIFFKPAWIKGSHFSIPLASYRFIFAYRNESHGDVCWVICCLNSLSVYIYLYFYNIYICICTLIYVYIFMYGSTHIKWAHIPWNGL